MDGSGITLTIGGVPPRGAGPGSAARTRAFRAELVGMLEADALWERGAPGASRPVWLAMAAGEQALAPFLANLRLGRPAWLTRGEDPRPGGPQLELLRSAGYSYQVARVAAGAGRAAVAEAWLPALCDLEGEGADAGRVALAAVCPAAWAGREAQALGADDREAVLRHAGRAGLPGGPTAEEVVALAVAAAYAAALLDRRTPAPVPPGPAFALRLLAALCRAGQASLARRDDAGPGDPWAGWRGPGARLTGASSAGVAEVVAIGADAGALEETLGREAAAYVADRRAGDDGQSERIS